MTPRRLLARLDRLTPAARAVLGQDRRRDGRRRNELSSRSLWHGLTEREEVELSELQAFFSDEDQERARMFELSNRECPFSGPPLTPAEKLELAELEHRYPPPNPYLDDAVVECINKAIEGWRRPSPSQR